MPLDALPEELPRICATLDWSTLRPAERALQRKDVDARIAGGDLPDTLAPLSCTRGRYVQGRFVDEDGNVYRLRDVRRVLGEEPGTHASLRAWRKARTLETISVFAVFIPTPGMYYGVIFAVANNGIARDALAQAVATYNATGFWAATEATYAGVADGIPLSVARATELVYAARGCTVDHADARFTADAQVVWDYARQGHDAGALVRAAEVAPVAGCDLAIVLPAGLAVAPAVITGPE